jgi:hypothetical protein|tara:strand:- start:793 stop:942 length:150 start_codon:yes stop_codon:yes gene_type:complete
LKIGQVLLIPKLYGTKSRKPERSENPNGGKTEELATFVITVKKSYLQDN